MNRRVIRPQALVFGIIGIIAGLICLGTGTPLGLSLMLLGIGVILLLLSGVIIKMRI